MTTNLGPRFCPRCGTALVAGHSFCPSCGFNTAEIGTAPDPAPARPIEPSAAPPANPVWPDIDPDRSAAATTPIKPTASAPPASARPFERRLPANTLVIGAVVIGVALIVLSQLTRTGPAGAPPAPPASGVQQQPGASAIGPGPALIVGLTIQHPADGQQVATKEVTVIGLAPPGLGITRDVSFGLDQHATADGTGHWAMSVGLSEGENKLKFRIGDDRSTEQTLRVVYTPQTP